MAKVREYSSLKEFYPYYLQEHLKPATRVLHFIGTGLIFPILLYALFTQTWWVLALIPVVGYGFAWVSHAFVEKNKPATFTYPLWSLASDFIMFWQLLTGKVRFRPRRWAGE